MTRGEVGVRPLLVDALKKTILYTNHIEKRESSPVNSALKFESLNNVSPNFCSFTEKFDINVNNLLNCSKYEIRKICEENYDTHWLHEINRSPKAIFYALFKSFTFHEKYLSMVKNIKHRKALSRLTLSNHSND